MSEIKGGVIEQKSIGVPLDLNGSFTNVELSNGVIQLTKDNEGVYHSEGSWTSEVINIGDRFKEYGKIFTTNVNIQGSTIAALTRTSEDGIAFDEWVAVGEDGAILSDKKQYIQVKIMFYAGMEYTHNKINLTGYENNEVEGFTLEGDDTEWLTPTLTSQTSASSTVGEPIYTSQSSTNLYQAWRAFDKINATEGFRTSALLGSIGFKFLEGKVANKYMMMAGTSSSTLNKCPKDWVLEGSIDATTINDGTWVVLDEQSGHSWATSQKKEFIFENKVAYTSYRIRITANNGNTSYSGIDEVDFGKTGEGIRLKSELSFLTSEEPYAGTGRVFSLPSKKDLFIRLDKVRLEDV